VHAVGTPAEVLTEATVQAVFGLTSRVLEDPTSGRPMMLPIGRHNVAVPAAVSAGSVGAGS
jgi:iron complex transport system ATP-binding protein